MPKSASCAFSSDSESAHASIRSSVASQLPVSRNSKPLTGAQSPPLQIHSERIHRIVVRFRAEVGHHWVFAGELCGPQESRGKATHLPRLSEIPHWLTVLEKTSLPVFSIRNFVSGLHSGSQIPNACILPPRRLTGFLRKD